MTIPDDRTPAPGAAAATLSSDRGAPGASRAAASALEAARAKLDLALLSLREITDPKVPVRRAELFLVRALQACYRALALRAQPFQYDTARSEALEATRQVLAVLQDVVSADSALLQTLGRTAAGLGLLLGATTLPSTGPTAPVGLDGQSVPLFAPASVDVPVLLEVARGIWPPTVPLSAPPEPPPEPPSDEPPVADAPAPAVTSAEELRAFAAAAAARFAEFEGQADADPADDDEAREDDATDAEPSPPRSPVAAEAAAIAAQIGPPPLDPTAHLEARAVVLLEELANLGNMRRPLGREPWAAPRTEQRLLARVDALAACGDEVTVTLVKLLEDRPLPDPALVWALIFFHGAWPGDDAADQIERLVLTAELGAPDMATFVSDALAHVPHPAIDAALVRWLSSPAAPLRAVALTALGRRRALPPPLATRALDDPAPGVVLAAAQAFGHLGGTGEVSGLAELLRRASLPAELERAAMVSASLLGSRVGVEHAQRRVAAGQGAHADAALMLALAGSAEHLAPLLGGPEARSPGILEALGWLGAIGAVPALIEALARDDLSEASREAASFALYRLTGAPLSDDDEPGPLAAAPDPTPWPSTFAPPDAPGKLAQKAESWRAWWDVHGAGARPELRYRYGRLWTVEATLWELGHRMTAAADRELLHVELVLRTGVAHLPLDREAFVVVQETQLAALSEVAVRAAVKPGTFGVRFART